MDWINPHGWYVFICNVILPTLDQFTDLTLMIDFLKKGIINWGIAVMFPVLANMIFTR